MAVPQDFVVEDLEVSSFKFGFSGGTPSFALRTGGSMEVKRPSSTGFMVVTTFGNRGTWRVYLEQPFILQYAETHTQTHTHMCV